MDINVAPAEARKAERPFVGARPFEDQDKAFFFGRDRDARDLADMVAACTLTVVYGPSGAGKSSLLNTRLADDLAMIEPDWIMIPFSSWQAGFEGALLASVTAALPPFDEKVSSNLQLEQLAQILTSTARKSGRPIALILDQFEEYFLYNINAAKEFESSLARLVNRRNAPVRVVLAMRSDRLFLLDRLRGRIPEVLQNLFLVDTLDEHGARDAVLKPVQCYNESNGTQITIADEVVDAVVKGADEREIFQRLPFRGRGVPRSGGIDASKICVARPRLRIVAPFLQLALESLWRQDVETAGGTTLSLAGMRTLANVGDEKPAPELVGLLAQSHLDTILSQRSEIEQLLCARLFDRMVTYAGGKVAVAWPDDFIAVLDQRKVELVRDLLNELSLPGPSRLVRKVAIDDPAASDDAAAAAVRYEITHDALAVPILDWVTRWRQRRAQAKAAAQQQRAAAEAMEEARKQGEQAQRKAEEQAKKAQRRTVLLSLVAITLFLGAFGGWAVVEYKAREAAIQRFNAFAAKDSSNEFRLRLLLAMSSLSEASGVWRPFLHDREAEAEKRLRDTLLRAPAYGGSATAAGFDADGSRMALLTKDQGLYALSLADGRREEIATAADIKQMLLSAPKTASDKLKQPPFAFIGFVQGVDAPVLIQAGIIHYKPAADGSVWRTIDLATLLPDGFDKIASFIRPDIVAGAVQLTAASSSGEISVVRLRANRGLGGLATFEPVTSMPPSIKSRNQRMFPALSPFMATAPHDRFALLDPDPTDQSDGQYTAANLTTGDLDTAGPVQTLWQTIPQSQDSRLQQAIESGGATAHPSVAFSDDGSAIVVRYGADINIIPLSQGAPTLSLRAPKSVGDNTVQIPWAASPLLAATHAATGEGGKPVWRVAWLTPGGLRLLQSTGSGEAGLKTLLTGMDNVMRVNFSADGRFVMAWGVAWRGGSDPAQQVRVWDLSDEWARKTDTSNAIGSLRTLACATAAREKPGGERFTDDEKLVWIGANGAQPCD